MNTLFLNPLLFRLGLTMLHSLWEVLGLAFLAWIGLAILRRQAASARYAFACTTLLAMVVAPLITFLWIDPTSGISTALILPVEGGSVLVTPILEANGLLIRASAFAPVLAMLWVLGFGIMVTRLGGGIWWLDRTYRTQAKPLAEPQQTRLDHLARRMGLNIQIRLLESRNADTPLVIGWLKPAILIPTSALLHLKPEALEAILAHELAHIQRCDYLANLLQCLAEAFLFFHPAAWWLSRQIRELREHCCDDAAAALCGDPMILAEGLSVLERLRRSLHTDPEPALAAAKGKLMFRISRLFQPQETQTPSFRGLAMVLVGASLLGITAMAAQKSVPPAKANTTATQPKVDAEGIADFNFSRIKIAYQPEAPAYPAEAKQKGIQGVVVVSITIDEQGLPLVVKATEGPEELRATATEYAKGWRFKPAQLNGKPVKARFLLTMPFRLRGGAQTAASGAVTEFDFSHIKVLHQPAAPSYPAEAKEKGIQGTVVVSITIDEAGLPTSAEALEGPEELRSTATEYAKQWRFEPAQSNGTPVKARFKLTMPFRLK